MIRPKALKVGDVVGVIAPSDAVEKESLAVSARIVEGWGLKIKYGKHIYAKIGDFSAGTAQERKEDLKEMIYDQSVKAVWAANGGYAATEVLPVLDKEAILYLRAYPKWFIGYSDVCLILNALSSYDMVSVTGPTLWGLADWDKITQDYLKAMLFGEKVGGIGEKANWKPVVGGEAEGRIVVSNLETLVLSFGTRFDPIMYGRGDMILGFEELEIDKSLLQRQVDIILSHKRAKKVKGIIVGRLTNIREKSYPMWGNKVTAEGLVADRARNFGVPMAFCNDFGHADWDGGFLGGIKKYLSNRRFMPIANGVRGRLTVGDPLCKLEYLEDICNLEDEPKTNPTAGLV